MATIDAVMRAIMRFADLELIPHLPTGKGIGAGIALALVMDGGRDQMLALREHPTIKLMRVMDESGNIDVDRLYNIARTKFDGKKLPITVPLLGEFKFDVNDLDKLYTMIQQEG